MTVPAPDPFQAEVARVALAAAGHGFALAGGQALIAHGILNRPTEDIDLFTDEPDGVSAAARPVTTALRAAGLTVTDVPETNDLGDLFDGFGADMAEYEIHDDTDTVRLQLVHFDRSHPPVAMTVGPVLHLDDAVATKVAAMCTRAEPRDLIDVAAILSRYTRARLVALARAADPALTDSDLTDAMRRLDRLDDSVFTDLYALTPPQITHLRQQFADWPRT